MGNEILTPATAIMAPASNTPRKSRENLFYNKNSFTIRSLPTEIWFEILAFVKFYEAPNIFLVNRYLLPICQVYFHSGTVGLNKYRIVRNLTMQLTEGSLTIYVRRNGTFQSVPVPEVDPPKIFKAFGHIAVEKCCRIEAMQFLYKFQSLLAKKNNVIIFGRNFFVNTTNAEENEKQTNSHSSSSVVVDEKQFFLNWIGQKKLLLGLKFHETSAGVARCLADEPLIAQFNGCLSIEFKNERNLCGLEEEAKLIYGWISSAGTRELEIHYYDAQKARELVCQIALLFEQAHINKIEAEKMDLLILLPDGTVVPMLMKKVCNGIGEHLATLRTISAKCSNGYITSTYVFYTKSKEYSYENNEEMELIYRKTIYFL